MPRALQVTSDPTTVRCYQLLSVNETGHQCGT